MSDGENLLKYQSFTSFVDVSFWQELASQKLNVHKLSEEAVPVWGEYRRGSTRGFCHLSVSAAGFGEHGDDGQRWAAMVGPSGESEVAGKEGPHVVHVARGSLVNVNTVENYRALDKKRLFADAVGRLREDIRTGAALEDPALLVPFQLFTFADLKKYLFRYQFAFPALQAGSWTQVGPGAALPEAEFGALSSELRGAFALHDGMRLRPLRDVREWEPHWRAVCADPGTLADHPAWPARNFLALLGHWLHEAGRLPPRGDVRLVLLRLSPAHSRVLSLRAPADPVVGAATGGTGWEKDGKGRVSSRRVDLAASMDPVRLARTAVELNLKLMRWRLMPNLDLAAVAATRALIIGAGTLGCNVARALLGWGVNHITLCDYGRVSLSNPVRQTLFTFADAQERRPKAEAAAAALRAISPSACATGHVLAVPMPGHAVAEADVAATRASVATLERLIGEHDVVFLLTDSRESRWLPSLLGAYHDKMLINAAMGYDSYVCMRHGPPPAPPGDEAVATTRLGCYFCNDVVAPQDSLSDRTLDQQCTVTRPGLSYITAATAVELMVSLIQHPRRHHTPADTSSDIHQRGGVELGILPHQIRGQLSHYHNTIMVGTAYDRCTACSAAVLDEFRSKQFDFVLRVLNDPLWLEEVTGLKELKEQTIDCAWDDIDEFFSDDDGGGEPNSG